MTQPTADLGTLWAGYLGAFGFLLLLGFVVYTVGAWSDRKDRRARAKDLEHLEAVLARAATANALGLYFRHVAACDDCPECLAKLATHPEIGEPR